MWDVMTGLTFGGLIVLLFLLGHYVGVLLLHRAQPDPETTQEQPK